MPQYGQSPYEQAGDAVEGMGGVLQNIFAQGRAKRFEAQKFAAQQAMEQQYLRLAQQKQQMEGPLIGAQVAQYGANTAGENQKVQMMKDAMSRSQMMGRLQGFRGSPNPMAMVADPYNGPQIMGDLRQAGVVPQGRFDLSQEQLMQAVNAALQGQTYQAATSTPAGAGRMVINPYQQAQVGETVRHHGALEEVAQGRNKIAQDRNTLLDTPDERRRREAMNILGRFLMEPSYKQESGPELNSALTDFIGGGSGASKIGQPPKISSKAEYDALAPGTAYIDPKGVPGVKGQ